MWAAAMVVMLCVSGLLSCSTNEKYEFEFEFPGQIVSQLGATIEVPFKAVNISSMSIVSVPGGWEVKDVSLNECRMTVVAPSKFADQDSSVENEGYLKMSGFTAAGTTVYVTSYLSLENSKIDLTESYANSYLLAKANTRYYIDVTHKGESQERISPAKIAVLWQSQKDLIAYDSYDAEAGIYTFYVGSQQEKDASGNVIKSIPYGNAVLAAYDAEKNILWSWHLWLAGDVNEVATSAGVFMDRNLGAYGNSDGSTDTDKIHASYGLYYQWGRKDPFLRPRDYCFTDNRDESAYTGSGSSKLFRYVTAQMVEGEVRDYPFGTMDYATADPFTFVLGTAENDYDWLHGEHDAELWSADFKSVNDPCPRGWRVPDATMFEAFDIDAAEDAKASADVKGQYGWHLVDNGSAAKLFMPAAGRRSFETGVLTNLNNYGYEHNPAPWVGYYWTASATDENKSVSMFFDLNTTRAVNNRYEPRKAMYRGNGMQVRCVKVQ